MDVAVVTCGCWAVVAASRLGMRSSVEAAGRFGSLGAAPAAQGWQNEEPALATVPEGHATHAAPSWPSENFMHYVATKHIKRLPYVHTYENPKNDKVPDCSPN